MVPLAPSLAADTRPTTLAVTQILLRNVLLRIALKYRERRGERVIPIVSFVGLSNSGKTTLLEKVVKELKFRGYRVAVVKHSSHGFDLDHPGKDSWRLAQAGSDVVTVSSPSKVAFIEQVDAELTLSQIKARIGNGVDIVLTEGYKKGNTARILVLTNEQDKNQLCLEENPLATISAHLSSLGVPQFDDEDVASVVNLLIEQIDENSSRKSRDVSMAADSIPAYSAYQMGKFEELLAQSASVHGHICPGQVLGVRMAIRGCQELGIEKPREENKRLVVYVEIDRCATDAIQIITGCKLGKRTMKYVDYGKLAATFVDLHSGKAARLVAREDAREKASLYHHEGWTSHETEVVAYKAVPDGDLFDVEDVLVEIPVEDMPGPPLHRVICDECGEGVNDRREVIVAGKVLCRSCAYGRYYQPLGTSRLLDDAPVKAAAKRF
jgi:formylmethanofuran dehydrogenase subunit E